ncbi:MAG: bifunctional molybdenum cofactor biosynthesis protein MoaC/MoaB [Gammaproteobacteria bacterium]|nr:bifunctional molybdenum cofactor biosynthesis protein MoaC/MoaB [Gammaproteobacteria bacterium]
MHTFNMVDVGNKSTTHRVACATGCIRMSFDSFTLIKNRQLPKGDPLPMAETAGILATKRTPELLPLCHPLSLEKVDFQFQLDEVENAIWVECTVSAHEKTGVEMEALLGVQIALLTLYDLIKPVDPALTITDIRLKSKQGGKRGLWTHPTHTPTEKNIPHSHFKNVLPLDTIQVALLTISDRASRGEYSDESGPEAKRILESWGVSSITSAITSDEKSEITNKLLDFTDRLSVHLIITTGGTGVSKRDHTPEVITSLSDRLLPGIPELLRHSGSAFTPFSCLSRQVAGIRNQTLIIALPGNPKAIQQSLNVLKEPLLHAVGQIRI